MCTTESWWLRDGEEEEEEEEGLRVEGNECKGMYINRKCVYRHVYT